VDPNLCAVTVHINGREVVTDMDIVDTANRSGKAGGGLVKQLTWFLMTFVPETESSKYD